MLFVDVHEVASGITRLLQKLGVQFWVKSLEVGDYLIPDKFVVERKTIQNLIHSIRTGQIFEQLKKLTEVKEVPMLLVEGDLEKIHKYSKMRTESVIGFLLSATVDFGVRLLVSGNLLQSALYLKFLQNRDLREELVLVRPRIRDMRDDRLTVLCAFPGIGINSAKKLLEKFGSLERIFNASRAELAAVVGEARADKMIKVLKSRSTQNSDFS